MTVRILQGDCRSILPMLPDCSVQCCVTSPPYYGLRDYGVGGQIGLEASPDEYIAEMVSVFREVRRVLRDDGTLWLNLGDSYANDGKWGGSSGGKNTGAHGGEGFRQKRSSGLKPKDRMMIPARVAIALQSDGWWIRDEVVWHKPRPTPHPVRDRTVCAHEMVYLLTKNAHYYYDWEAIEEPSAYPGLVRRAGKAFRDLAAVDPNAARKRPGVDRDIVVRDTRRARSVWSISPSPYTGAHFATMPPDLAERCIRAGTRKGDVVLDPFSGAGTTALVSDRLGRAAIGIELNADYATGSDYRIAADFPLFAAVAAE